jgi:endonuclease/exonuclease/phosphatase family metal-dependent hydrolase
MKSPTDSLPIRILTHNIRYATSSPFKGEKPWPTRSPRLLGELRFQTRHNSEAFICLQEVLHVQLADILTGLNNRKLDPTTVSSDGDSEDEWTYIGVGRDDGRRAGEYSPILYRPTVWSLQGSQTIWLSPTPTTPSRGWDAASIRILTIGVFRHRISKKNLVVMNTHLDDQGAESRYQAARIISRKVSEYRNTGLPVVVAGDFNSEPSDRAYRYLTDTRPEYGTTPLRDLRDLVPAEERYGNEYTFTGFGCDDEPRARIDFLFLNGFAGRLEPSPPALSPDPSSEAARQLAGRVSGYAVLSNRFDDGVFISDHRAVVGDVVLT